MFILIDGKKFKVDPSDSSKALLGADGQPVPFVEDTPAPPRKSVDEIANENPEVAAIIAENKRLAEEAAERERVAEQQRQEQMRQNGEFEKIANEANARAEKLQTSLNETNAILEKYKGTANELLEEMMSQIPDDKKSLVPEGGARTRIDYIRKNAKHLGVSLIGIDKGSNVPPNETPPPLDDTAKLRKEFSELLAKPDGTLTKTEQARMTELSKLLKKAQS